MINSLADAPEEGEGDAPGGAGPWRSWAVDSGPRGDNTERDSQQPDHSRPGGVSPSAKTSHTALSRLRPRSSRCDRHGTCSAQCCSQARGHVREYVTVHPRILHSRITVLFSSVAWQATAHEGSVAFSEPGRANYGLPGQYLGDATVTAATLDRLAMTAIRLDIDGPNYRLHLVHRAPNSSSPITTRPRPDPLPTPSPQPSPRRRGFRLCGGLDRIHRTAVIGSTRAT